MRLKKVFEDLKVEIEGKGQFGQYGQLFKLTPVESPPITVEQLQEHVTKLQQKYTERGFKLKQRGLYHIIDQNLYKPDGKKKTDRVPIYFNLQTQEIFIPSSYFERKPKLVGYILTRTLGALGIAKVRYIKTISKNSG
jgi:hypothetical protein